MVIRCSFRDERMGDDKRGLGYGPDIYIKDLRITVAVGD